MYTQAVLCRSNLGIRLLGGEEHIARGKESHCKLQQASRPTDGTLVRTEVRMRSLAFLRSLFFVPDRKFPSSQHWGALEAFWEGSAGRQKLLLLLPLLCHTHISSFRRCAEYAPLRPNGAWVPGRVRPSTAL